VEELEDKIAEFIHGENEGPVGYHITDEQIDRLRARTKQEIIDGYKGRVEELEAEVSFMDQPTTVKALEQREEMFQLVKEKEARVEELEEDHRWIDEMYEDYRLAIYSVNKRLAINRYIHFLRDRHHITDEQIDAAVEQINTWKTEDPVYTDYESGWETLNKLGIRRCEGCGGSGKFFSEQLKCWTEHLDCNGHGWMKEESDE